MRNTSRASVSSKDVDQTAEEKAQFSKEIKSETVVDVA